VIVGGHNWNGQWYNTGSNVIGRCGKTVRLGFKDGKYCVVFGGAASSWEYGTIVLRKIHNGAFYTGIMDMGGAFTTSQTATESFTWVTGDLRVLRSSAAIISDDYLRGTEVYSSNWFRNDNSGTGIYNSATSNHFYSDGPYWNVAYSGTQGIRFRNGHNGTILGYIYAETDGNFGLLSNNGGWAVQVKPGGGGNLNGTWTINSNTPLTSANYSGYALPLTGGTLTGALTINATGSVLGTAYNHSTYFGGTTAGSIRGSNEGYIVISSNSAGTSDKSIYLNSAASIQFDALSHYRFNKPSTAGYQTVALFGTAASGLFLTTDSPIISTGAYYNNGWIATAASGTLTNYANGAYEWSTFSGATVGSAPALVSRMTLSNAGTLNVVGSITQNGNQVLHAGNYTSYTAPNAANLPYSWSNTANVAVFSGSYGYNANAAKYLLLWQRTSGATGTNGRFVDGMLKVWRGANHAGNGGTVGYVHASSGYSGQSSEVLNYTPFSGQGLTFSSVVYNSVEWIAVAMPVSDYFWEFRGNYGIQGDTTTVPILVQAGQAGVGTVTNLATGSPIITSSTYSLFSSFTGTVSGSNFSGPGTGLTGLAAGLSIGGSAAQLNGQAASYYENRDTTAVGFSGGTLTLTRAAGNLTVSLDGRYLPLTGGTLTGILNIQSASDNQLLLQGTDTWAGIGFRDSANVTDFIWYWGATQTFAIGGGGSAGVSGKKLHIDGGVTIGSSYDAVSMPTNGLNVEGAIQQSGNQVLHAGNYASVIGYTPAYGTGAYQTKSLDTVSTPGLYQYDGGFGGTKPPDNSPNYRTIEIGNGNRFSQIAMPWDSDGFYFRRQQGSTFTSWRTVLHDGNYTSYAPNINGGSTIAGITYFSNGESMQVYGIRGRFTNEYLHLYNKVGVGHPSGWGSGEGNTPDKGLSTYGGINVAYGNAATSSFGGQLNANAGLSIGGALYHSIYTRRQIALPGPGSANFGSWKQFIRLWAATGAGANMFTLKISVRGTWNWTPVFGTVEAYYALYLPADSTISGTRDFRIVHVSGPAADNLRIGDAVIENGFVSIPVWGANTNGLEATIEQWYGSQILGTVTSAVSEAMPAFIAPNFRGGLTSDGNAVLHAGNYTGYFNNFVQGAGSRGRSSGPAGNSANNLTDPSGFYFGNNVTGMPTTDWWNWTQCIGNSWSSPDGYGYQLAYSFWSDDIRMRRLTSGTWNSWVSLLHSGNYNNYTIASRGNVDNIDFNTYGNYNMNMVSGYIGSSANKPTNFSYGYGTTISFSMTGSPGQAQFYVSHAGNDLCFRGGWNGSSWQTWNKCLTDQNFPSINTYATSIGNTLPDRVFMSNDANIKYAPRDTAKAHLGLTAKYANSRPNITGDSNYWTGVMGWGTTDWNSVFDWGSGFTDSWSSPANNPGDTSHHLGIQSVHYTNGSARYGWQMVNGVATGKWWLRDVWGGSFSSWREIIHSGNYTAYPPARWATGRTISLTGDVTGTSVAFDGTAALSFAATIANSSVTYAKIQNVAVSSVLGNSSASVAQAPQALSMATLAGMLSGQTMNIAGSSTSCTGNAATATLATKASTLSQGGGNGSAMTFNWAGQSGQPSWLWGSNDGVNIYVWNPSNFSVASAASCSGSAAQLNGQAASYYENRDTTSVSISAGTLTLGRGAGNLTTTLGGRTVAWCEFNGNFASSQSPNASFNVSSITKNATGDYTVNFSSSLGTANYVVAGTAQLDTPSPGASNYNVMVAVPRRSGAKAAGSCRVVCEYPAGVALYDSISVGVAFIAA
jgi:hypothetical protein